MSRSCKDALAAAVSRVICDSRSRSKALSSGAANQCEFRCGEKVLALKAVKNDGVCPHKDIGEILVCEGDAGFIRERWKFLGETYYTVGFAVGAVVVIMRGREIASAAGKEESSIGLTTQVLERHPL